MKLTLTILATIATLVVQAQAIFISKGKIEYEKQLNMHKEIDEWYDDGDDLWRNNIKKNVPKIQTTYYNLVFEGNKTLYSAGKEGPTTVGFQKIPEWMKDKAAENVTYNDLDKSTTISQKNVFETIFLIEDSTRTIDWRLTSDTRTIAGFECRKAVGKVMDSVYVIAFYTDVIMSSGGPESITGLPGMILGVAIPRMNTTWFATKVELAEVKPTDFAIPTKGKKAKFAEVIKQIKVSTKNWGKNAEKNIWRAVI